MQLDNAFIAVLLVLILCLLARGGHSAPEVVQNLTIGSLQSQSPWLANLTSNHRHHPPRTPGCRRTPWICRRGRHRPRSRMRCCRNRCVDVSSDNNNCGLCGIRCPFTWHCCRGFCVNTNISPFNCGKCGHRCPWGVHCVYGMCGYAEPLHPSPWPQPPRLPFPPMLPKPWPWLGHPAKGDEQSSDTMNS